MTHQRMSGRRIACALVMVFITATLLFTRLVDVQVVRASELQEQSAAIRTTDETVWASRGSIIDSFGNDLALDVDRYDLSADPSRAGDFRRDGETISLELAMAEIATLTGANPDELIYAVASNTTTRFTYLIQGVSPEIRLALRELRIPWLQMDLVRERTYPFGPVVGNLTGMLGTDEPLAELSAAITSAWRPRMVLLPISVEQMVFVCQEPRRWPVIPSTEAMWCSPWIAISSGTSCNSWQSTEVDWGLNTVLRWWCA